MDHTMIDIPSSLRSRIRTPNKQTTLEVRPSYTEGTFNSLAVDCPCVFTLNGKTGMTLVGWDGIGYQGGLSWLGNDGKWSEPELILPRNPDSAHRKYNAALTGLLRDNNLAGKGELCQVDSWYYGTYHAYPNAGYEEGSAVIGIVRSRDLRIWEEYGELLRPEDGDGWERGGLYKSWLLQGDGKYWLFYNAKNTETGSWVEQTGAAVSDDLLHWTRIPGPLLVNGPKGSFDDRFASDPCVLRIDDLWVMFYFGLCSDGHARELFAVSDDLVNWTKGDEVLINIGPKDSIDSTHAHKPAVIYRGGHLEHYYCAVSALPVPLQVGNQTVTELRGIAVARS